MNNRFGFVPVLLIVYTLVAFCAGYLTYPFAHGAPLFQRPDVAVATNPSTDLGVFWEAWKLLDQNFLGNKPDRLTRTYAATRGMVESFADPYTVFVEPHPQELQDDSLRGKFGGIGARIEKKETGFFLRPIPDQPAAVAGILDGDQLLKVDDAEISNEMSSDDVVAHIRGEVGTEVALVVSRTLTATATIQALDFKILRAELELPSIFWQVVITDSAESGNPIKIGYMQQSIFSERTPDEMTKALTEMRQQGADRFIWDLRGNPGGRVDSATQLADIWLDQGIIVSEKHADGTNDTIEAKTGGDGVDLPLLLVVDGGSASASEIVAGALRDNGRAQLIGQRTFGKGSVQLLYTLSDGSSLHVTNAQWFTPNGHQISGQGLEPDISVAPELDPLLKAVELLVQMKK